MKPYLLSLLFLTVTVWTVSTQTNVTLNIHHELAGESFDRGETATNNIGSTFNYSRLEYYISEISLIHDGGQETLIEDLYILVDADENTSQELGSINVSNVEAIRFHIGVDEEHNHLDPASYDASHPLAPQLPSMHWGWASGYRFGAFEGNSGSDLTQTWEFHPLGDQNYFQTEVLLDLEATNGELVIDLDADYTRSMENIDVDAGPHVHGDYGDAVVALQNFQEYVFSASDLVSNDHEVELIEAFRLYPNPAAAAGTSLFIATAEEQTYQVRITDALGRIVLQRDNVRSNQTVELALRTAGLYSVSLLQAGTVLKTEKLIIQ